MGKSFALSLVVLFFLTTAAEAALPAHVAQRIAATARDNRNLAREDAAIARTLNNQSFTETIDRSRHLRVEAEMSTVVIGAIAQYPALAGEVVAAAVAAAPDLRDSIVRNASQAFPGFADTITRAAGGAVAAPRPAPAPAPRIQPAPPEPMKTAMEQDDEVADAGPDELYDPLEGINRAVLGFNDVIDFLILKPVASVYGFITPDAVKRSVQKAIRNLNAPVILANDLLQFEIGDAAVTTARFVVNSTAGVLGLFEVADEIGLDYHPADFGQTLHAYGSGPGPYLVLPLLGPSTLRDGVGIGVDTFFDPFTYVLDFPTRMMVLGGKAVVRREELLEPLDELRAGAIDYYAALRSAYFQNRAVELRKGELPDSSEVDDMFDSFQ
ncbi:MAG: VacJ family lipoprotein [Rhodospirillales bacterium]|jgi:phospholipid-binding lipoprotein MlaA|nr:VacJ family lipoprotein [Rhodospirillales bacterium]MDP6883997.1 VacJ family lipoprotein [Rhodospirillales bacterium]